MQNTKNNESEVKSQQIRFVSHEIRNHLSVCDMYAQIIKRHIENDNYNNPSVLNAVDCIQKSLQIINMNVTDLRSLDLSVPKIINFKNTAICAVKLAKAYVEDKNIEFECFIKNDAEICIDENRFLSCIVNIIKNAVESIEIKGKISIIGEVKDNIAILKISNTGKQIPPDKQKRIFECGYTSKQNGSGYGLNICKQYLNSQNSDLELVKSTKSETVFKITIPIK